MVIQKQVRTYEEQPLLFDVIKAFDKIKRSHSFFQ